MGNSEAALARIRKSKYPIALGFGLLLALVLSISISSFTRLNTIDEKINLITQNHHLKAELLHQMHKIVSERSLSVQVMAGSTDPFQRDEEYMHYNHLASRFITLRAQLEAMTLSAQERAQLENTLELIRRTQPTQDTVTEQILDDVQTNPIQLLSALNWPIEKQLYSAFNKLIELENNSAREEIEQTTLSHKQTIQTLFILSLTTIIVGVLIAISVIRRTGSIERSLFEEKKQAEITLHAIGDAVISTDTNNCIEYMNPIAESLLGKSLVSIQHWPLSESFALLDNDGQPINLSEQLNAIKNEPLKLDSHSIKIVGKNNTIAIEGSASLIHNKSNRVTGKVIIFRDVSENRNLAELLTWQATHDSLTGLINRREFERLLTNLLKDAKNNLRTHTALYIDLDQFKIVNDTCGHIAGDKLLQQLTTILQSEIRGSDTFARLGGDEFGVLLESCQLNKAEKIANALLNKIQSSRFSWEGHLFKIGASIGVVKIDSASEDVSHIMRAADSACYVAKDKGRNRIWIHHDDDKEINERHGEMALTSRINQALEDNQFSIYKQLIKSINQGKEHRIYELLIRMLDDSGKIIMPMAFIPAAERYTIMPNIDRWMIKSSFQRLADMPDIFNEIDLISVNLSGQSFTDDGFLDFVVGELDQKNIDPEKICFEITETSAIANWIRVTRFISVLRGMGCKFALDDFGSGMSSFTYLRNLSVDFIKIDGSFVRNIDSDDINKAMIKAIHNVGQVMKIKTIAEFVETDLVLEELSEIGIDYVQGFSIHVPEPL